MKCDFVGLRGFLIFNFKAFSLNVVKLEGPKI